MRELLILYVVSLDEIKDCTHKNKKSKISLAQVGSRL
jgi:hypothetical protein